VAGGGTGQAGRRNPETRWQRIQRENPGRGTRQCNPSKRAGTCVQGCRGKNQAGVAKEVRCAGEARQEKAATGPVCRQGRSVSERKAL